MGNTLLDKPLKKKSDPLQQVESWFEQNPELMNKKLLQENKSFRTISFMHKSKSQSLLFKVYLKREELSFDDYLRGFETLRKALDPSYYHNMLPFMQFKNFDQPKEGFVAVIRQYIGNTLQERLQGLPSLTQEEKIWMILQMVICVYGLHVEANLYHGNIRTSNFLLQSNNHMVLADFALYKPLYLVEHDLSEARIFYSSSVDKCTLAPEKLISDSDKERDNRLPMELIKLYKKEKFNPSSSFNLSESMSKESTDSLPTLNTPTMEPKLSNRSSSDYTGSVRSQKVMDIFSLGVSILEVLLNGKTIMNFENLLELRKGEFSLQSYIDAAVEGLPESERVKGLLGQMLEREPEKRPSIEVVMGTWKEMWMKEIHTLVWYLQSVFSKSSFVIPDLRIGLLRKIIQRIEGNASALHRHKMVMDLSTDMQKLDFARMMITLIDRNILPNLQKVGFLKGSLLTKMEEELEEQAKFQETEDKEELKGSTVSKAASLFEMKPKESVHKDQVCSFTSIDNLKAKDFGDRSHKLTGHHKRSLCPPEWTQELAALQKTKLNGPILSDQELSHNQFQDFLVQIRDSQSTRRSFQESVNHHFEPYEQLLRLIYSNIRNTLTVSNRLVGIELLYVVGKSSSPKAKLYRTIPYLINIMGDPEERVSTYSLRCLIDLFYSCCSIFGSVDDTKYYRTILEGFNTASKSAVLRLVLFERLPEILKIIEWLSIQQLKYTNVQSSSDQQSLIESILKQYGSYNAQQMEVLLSSASKLWLPSFIPFFCSMLNNEKVLGFGESVKVAEEATRGKSGQLDFLDPCLESGLDESGVAVFYAIRYFRIRKIIKEELIKKILPLLLEPNRWIHEEVEEYIRMCLHNYPPTKLYFIFNKYLELPFPIEPAEDLGLPKMLSSQTVRAKEFNEMNKTQEEFKKYNAKRRPQKEYPQIPEEQLKKWNETAKSLVSSEGGEGVARSPNTLGADIIDCISQMNTENLLYYISLIKKPYSEQVHQQSQQYSRELYELCDKSYNFNIYGNVHTISYQKHLLSHIESYLTTNSESFLKAQGLTSLRFKRLFSQNLLKTISLLNTIEVFEVIPTYQLGRYARQPTEQAKMSRPMGILIGEIHQHKDIISCIEKVADRFFLSGSYDGTMRLFDSKRLEDDITSDSIGVIDFKQEYNDYSGTIKVTSACVFEETYTVVAATTKGNANLYRVEYMGKESPSKNKTKKTQTGLELVKTFNATGQVEKVVTLKNELRHTTFGAVTSEGWLALQDIRVKKECLKCNLGKQRGIAKSFINLPGYSTLVVGTINGYILLYDIRCNLVSSIYELNSDGQSLPVVSMQTVPSIFHSQSNQQLIAISYASKSHEFAYFDLNSYSQQIIDPELLFTSNSREDCIVTPFLVNKTRIQNFKNFNNNLREKTFYNNFLPQFYSKLDILDYLKDPLTLNENAVKEKWLVESKQKYAQITSISNKKCVPFLEYLAGGILTNMNPTIASKSQPTRPNKGANNLTLLNTNPYKKDNKIISPIEREVKVVGKNAFIPEEEASDFYTACRVLPHFLVAGSRDSMLKVYK